MWCQEVGKIEFRNRFQATKSVWPGSSSSAGCLFKFYLDQLRVRAAFELTQNSFSTIEKICILYKGKFCAALTAINIDWLWLKRRQLLQFLSCRQIAKISWLPVYRQSVTQSENDKSTKFNTQKNDLDFIWFHKYQSLAIRMCLRKNQDINNSKIYI